jgi:hypothetical protein
MTKKTNEEVTETTEATEVAQPFKADTAFMVIKTSADTWHIMTDLSNPIEIERVAGINEVRMACSEVANAITQQQIAAMVASVLTPQQSADSVPETESEGTIKE